MRRHRGMVAFIMAFLLDRSLALADGDDFSNNLFTDLTPILALFGERVTTQFLSEAMGFADCVILAMAPLGIITIIVSAIRVGGPMWLKAIIGRARENLSAAEMELMSSTSKEVCELYNGEHLVRCQGSAPIWEFIILLPKTREGLDSFSTAPNVETSTLEDAIKKGWLRKTDGRSLGPFTDSINPSEEAGGTHPEKCIRIIASPCDEAPNVAMNRHNRIGRTEIYLVAIIATCLQVGVLILFGAITYHQKLKPAFQKDGKAVDDYAFPLAAGGTCLLVLGMLICAHVVEESTVECYYEVNSASRAQIVWLQQEKRVGDQEFKSFSIFPTSERRGIITSRRKHRQSSTINRISGRRYKPANWGTTTKTILGTIIGLVGFVIQFVGLRGMSWVASVTQLGAVGIMSVLRAWIRRGLAQPLESEELTPDFELDWLATTLGNLGRAPWLRVLEEDQSLDDDFVKVSRRSQAEDRKTAGQSLDHWTVSTGGRQEYECFKAYNNLEKSLPQAVLRTRCNLSRFVGWRGPLTEEAIRLTQAIEAAMNILFHDGDLEGNLHSWSLPIQLNSRHPARSQFPAKVSFLLRRENSTWHARVDEMESLLSLSFRDMLLGEEDFRKGRVGYEPELSTLTVGDSKLKNPYDDSWLRSGGPRSYFELGFRLLGPNEGGDLDSLVQDLRSWMPGGLKGILKVTEVEPSKTTVGTPRRRVITVRNNRVVGYGRRFYNHSVGLRRSDKTLWSTQSLSEGEEEEGEPIVKAMNIPKQIINQEEKRHADFDHILAIETHDTFEKLHAKDILFAFMCSAAKTLPQRIRSKAEMPPSQEMDVRKSWTPARFRSEDIDRLAAEFQQTVFEDEREAYLAILPPLSMEAKLPYPEEIFDTARNTS